MSQNILFKNRMVEQNGDSVYDVKHLPDVERLLNFSVCIAKRLAEDYLAKTFACYTANYNSVRSAFQYACMATHFNFSINLLFIPNGVNLC